MQRTGRKRQEHLLLFCYFCTRTSNGFLAYVTSVRTSGKPRQRVRSIQCKVIADILPGYEAKIKTLIVALIENILWLNWCGSPIKIAVSNRKGGDP